MKFDWSKSSLFKAHTRLEHVAIEARDCIKKTHRVEFESIEGGIGLAAQGLWLPWTMIRELEAIIASRVVARAFSSLRGVACYYDDVHHRCCMRLVQAAHESLSKGCRVGSSIAKVNHIR